LNAGKRDAEEEDLRSMVDIEVGILAAAAS
jgi:hypothetical protein